MATYPCVWLALSIIACISVTDSIDRAFQLPVGFEGVWQGVPYSTVLGAWTQNNMTFAISRAASGDYLMVTNLKYDAQPDFAKYWSWQRSYIKSAGQWSGNILHCPGPRSPSLKRQAMMRATSWPAVHETSVTFCLQKWEGYEDLDHPFPFTSLSCYDSSSGLGCGCFNWTLSLDDSGDRMDYQVSMSGSYAHTKHLWVRFHRAGSAPPVLVQMPGDGDAFVCEYGGRDGHVVDEGHIAHRCPFAAAHAQGGKQEEDNALRTPTLSVQSAYPHCYVLNEAARLVLEWEMDASRAQLHVKVSADAVFGEDSYVAIGFRPLGGASTSWARDHGTGREQRFGMRGADMVLGHAHGFRQMYAQDYAGQPLLDESLQVTDVEIGIDDDLIHLRFSRPLAGGWLHAKFGVNVSITSDTSDMMWAIGRYSKAEDFPLSHGVSRGWREINWTDPDFDRRPLESMRPYRCGASPILP